MSTDAAINKPQEPAKTIVQKETPELNNLTGDNTHNHSFLFLWVFNFIGSIFIAPLTYKAGSTVISLLIAGVMFYSLIPMVHAMKRIMKTDSEVRRFEGHSNS